MPAVWTFDTGKTVVQITAVKVAVDNLFGIGAEEAIQPAETLIVDLFKGLEVVFISFSIPPQTIAVGPAYLTHLAPSSAISPGSSIPSGFVIPGGTGPIKTVGSCIPKGES